MRSKTVLFLGAGFSVDAKIPVQNNILKQMIQDPTKTASTSGLIVPESKKFLKSYIEVGLFLLKKFTKEDTSSLTQSVNVINYLENLLDVFDQESSIEKTDVLKSLLKFFSEKSFEKELLAYLASSTSKKFVETLEAQYYVELVKLRENIRLRLEKASLNIDLEDIFTIFDKSLREYENWDDITYLELDKLRHSLLRLFTYYFGTFIANFKKRKSKSYNGFIQYCVKNNASILTTNWDTVLEILFRKEKIDFHTQIEGDKIANNINMLKLHGSINWFKCNRCGNYHVTQDAKIAKYLFDDTRQEECKICGAKANEKQILLQPEIITPTMLKTLNNKIFREIWAEAASNLDNADKIIFIGYSLPLADFEVRYLLKKHIRNNTKIEVVLAKNDCPIDDNDISSKPEGRYKTLFPANEITFHYKGLKYYFDTEVTC